MKILMVIRTLGYSGAFKMFVWLAESLARKGHNVSVCTWEHCDDVQLSTYIRRIKLCSSNKNFITVANSIRRIVRKEQADISISFLLDANIYNILACLGNKTKSIVCERNDPFKPGYYKLKLLKPLFRFANGAVYQLPMVAQYYDNIKVPTAIIPNPVFTGKDLKVAPFADRPNVIVSIGRLDLLQKRQDILIKAFMMFVQACPDYILKFYGDGPDEDKLRDIVNRNGLQNKVQFMGVTHDVTSVLMNSKIFVLTSDFEGIPNALIEAMTLGLPCVATDCRPGGANLLIKNGINGVLVPCGDEKAVSDALIKIATNEAFANLIGEEAQNLKETFHEEKIIEKWTRYLLSLK